MKLYQILRICQAYNALGWAVQEQLHELSADPRGEFNPNAVNMIERTLLSRLPDEARRELECAILDFREYERRRREKTDEYAPDA